MICTFSTLVIILWCFSSQIVGKWRKVQAQHKQKENTANRLKEKEAWNETPTTQMSKKLNDTGRQKKSEKQQSGMHEKKNVVCLHDIN